MRTVPGWSALNYPWIGDYAQDYTQSICHKWLKIHETKYVQVGERVYRTVKDFKGLLSKSNRWEMSVSQFISPVCPQWAAVASGHSPLTLGITWKKKPDASSHSASLHLSENNWSGTFFPKRGHERVIACSKNMHVWQIAFETEEV